VPGAECEEYDLSGVDGGTNAGLGVQLEALHGRQIPLRRRLLYARQLNGLLPQDEEEYHLWIRVDCRTSDPVPARVIDTTALCPGWLNCDASLKVAESACSSVG